MTRIITVKRRLDTFDVDVDQISSFAPYKNECRIYLKDGRRIDCLNSLANNKSKTSCIRQLIAQANSKVNYEVNRASG